MRRNYDETLNSEWKLDWMNRRESEIGGPTMVCSLISCVCVCFFYSSSNLYYIFGVLLLCCFCTRAEWCWTSCSSFPFSSIIPFVHTFECSRLQDHCSWLNEKFYAWFLLWNDSHFKFWKMSLKTDDHVTWFLWFYCFARMQTVVKWHQS